MISCIPLILMLHWGWWFSVETCNKVHVYLQVVMLVCVSDKFYKFKLQFRYVGSNSDISSDEVKSSYIEA
jgi:hypothetical protein